MDDESIIVKYILSGIINMFHLIMVLFIVGTPFFGIYRMKENYSDSYKGSNYLILFYFFYIFISTNLMAHWYLNNQHCCLTALDNKLWGRELRDTSGFISKLLVPLFTVTGKPNESELSFYIWFLTNLFLVMVIIAFLFELYSRFVNKKYKIPLLLLKEALAVGFISVLIGYPLSFLLRLHSREYSHLRLICFLFSFGFLIHLLCEYTGINQYYCKEGNACQ
jgi:hypothetical protein